METYLKAANRLEPGSQRRCAPELRPFMSVPDVGRKGAGVLRDKPNINWNKDRGKDVKTAPWYHLGPVYNGNVGDRINDHHLTLAEKKKAREAPE